MSVRGKKTIYSIAPNANGFGFVVMEGPRDLLDFGTIRIRPVRNSKIIIRIRKDIEFYCPDVIVVLFLSKKGNCANNRNGMLVELIRDFSSTKDIMYYQYTRDDIACVFDEFKKRTKNEIADFLLTEFSILRTYKPRKRKLWTSEDRNMAIFDALALAIVYFFRL